ncbi:MAG: thioredoxin family protein [Bacteroidetes bacterium HGW-Bacteroidetes-3]|nr:MAG: thioredoxin family protein [Bacteroidetes bacterium HGW-Bacteroidetes-3]
MNLKTIFTLALTILIFNFSSAQAKPKSADEILNTAYEQAKKENKNVIVMFHASWCGWCKKMDASMNDISTKELFDKNYVISHLDVLESANKKQLENFGAEALLNKYGGEKQGIPYVLIFDSEGNLLADSKMVENKFVLKEQGNNIGCPGTAEEIAAFNYKLKETSNLNEGELAIIAERFKLNNPN